MRLVAWIFVGWGWGTLASAQGVAPPPAAVPTTTIAPRAAAPAGTTITPPAAAPVASAPVSSSTVTPPNSSSPTVSAAPTGTLVPGIGLPGYLGVQLRDAVPVGSGAWVAGVISNGPADRGGVQAGDVIIRWQNEAIRTPADIGAALQRTPIGSGVTLTVRRQGVDLPLNLVIETRSTATGVAPPANAIPPTGSMPPTAPVRGGNLGVIVSDTPPVTWRNFLGSTPPPPGAHVTHVMAGTPAQRAGIPVSATITQLNGQAIRSCADLRTALLAVPLEQPVTLVYSHRGVTQQRIVTLAASLPAATIPASPGAANVGPPTAKPTLPARPGT